MTDPPDFSFTETLFLRVPPEEAFEFVAEPANGPSFDPTIVAITTDPYPMRVGSINRVTARLFGIPVRALSRVVEFEPGCRMVVESVRPTWPARVRAIHRLEPVEGGTRYDYTVEYRPARFGRLFARLACASMRRTTHAAARRLTAILGPLER